MTQELFYPETEVSIGNYVFSKGVELEAYSSKDSYYDWAKIRFTQEFQPKISITEGNTASTPERWRMSFRAMSPKATTEPLL